MKKCILNLVSILLLLLFSISAFATEMTLGKITSDIDKDYALLVYDRSIDTGEIIHLYADSYSQGVRVNRQEFDDNDLERGIVLLKKDKYEIVKLGYRTN